jgi:2,4-dienoyl-CoA reductase-like NADH-dependent reductase (Old Yellow Enzyme family)
MTNPLAQPLDLPCGVTLANRFAKAAMSEGLADTRNHSTPRLETLYRRWVGSGAGLLLSGNIQVDRSPGLPKPERRKVLTSGLSPATRDARSATTATRPSLREERKGAGR